MDVQIRSYKGKLFLFADGKRMDALAFKSFRPTSRNVQDFYRAGVRLFHVYCSGLPSGLKMPYSLYGETWFGDHCYDFTNLDRQIEFFRENAPEALVFVNVHLDNREWWRNSHPGSADSFRMLSQVAADEDWRRDTADYLKALIRHTEEKYPDFVAGYFLLGGYTTEWFSQFDEEETHPTKLAAWRACRNDPQALIPPKEVRDRPETEIFLDPKEDEELIDYRRFHHDLIADTVLYYAAAAQEELHHHKPVGLFFGYILELMNSRLWNAGHLFFDKINNSPDIDILATPSSYQFRAYDDAGAFMLLCDTLEKCGKMCWISFDHTTYLVPGLAKNPERLCGDPETQVALDLLARMRSGNPRDVLHTRKQTFDAMRREFLQSLTKRTGLWWFDMLEGWFYDPELMEEVSRQVKLYHELDELEKASASEIAVFVSGRSLLGVNKCSRINTELICNQRGDLSRMGAPYDIFAQMDLEEVNLKAYKMIMLTDAFVLSEGQKNCLNAYVQQGGTVLYIAAPDYLQGGKEAVEALIGMKLENCTLAEKEIRSCNVTYGYENAHVPAFYVSEIPAQDPDYTILGRYDLGRQPALVRRKVGKGAVIFSGIGNVGHEVLRTIAREAGVHIYAENGIAVFVSKGLYGVYHTGAEYTTLNLPENGEYEEVFSGTHYRVTDHTVILPTGQDPAQLLRRISD